MKVMSSTSVLLRKPCCSCGYSRGTSIPVALCSHRLIKCGNWDIYQGIDKQAAEQGGAG